MNAALPIKDKAQLADLKNYYRLEERNLRNLLLITMGLNTALRISDILCIRWKDVYDIENERYYEHMFLTEKKTGKASSIYINQNIISTLEEYRLEVELNKTFCEENYLFCGMEKEPITRVQAYRIIRKAAKACGIQGTISPHSLRKTFGYFAWKSGVEPVLLMNIYNHSSFSVTKRYLGIEQDDRDEVFRRICI